MNSFSYGAAATWAKVVAAQQTLEAAFTDADNACWVIGTGTAAKWRQALRGSSTSRFILDDMDGRGYVGQIPAYVSTFVGSTEQTILANWSQLVFASFGEGVDVVYDPFTKANTGEIVITANIYYQGFIRRPTTFVVSTDGGNQ